MPRPIENFEQLEIAIEAGNLKNIQKLFETKKISRDSVDSSGRNALHCATAKSWNLATEENIQKNRDIIDYLVRSGVKIDAQDNLGKTPLSYTHHLDPALRLLAGLPDNDARRKYIDASQGLHTAANNKNLFEHYLSLGADVTLKDGTHKTWVARCPGSQIQERLDALTQEQRQTLFNMPSLLSDGMEYATTKKMHIITQAVPDRELNRLTRQGLTALDHVEEVISELKRTQQKYGTEQSELDAADALRQSLIDRGARRSEEIEESIKSGVDSSKSLAAYLETVENSEAEILPVTPPNPSDFASVPTLPDRPNRGPVTNILVIEHLGHSDQEGGAPKYSHIDDTSYIANGVMQKLLGPKERQSQVIPIYKQMDSYLLGLERHALLASEKLGAHTVISHSMAERFDDAPYFSYNEDRRPPLKGLGNRRVVLFQSNGNEGHDRIDIQNSRAISHTPDTMNIGASHARRQNPSLREVANYSENGSLFLAPVLTKNGQPLEGTSFAIPYAAGVYAALYRRYGQWDKNPYGLSPEEVKWAMSASARTDLIDPDTGRKINFDKRPDGVALDKKAGFGEIEAMAADRLARDLFAYKESNKITNNFASSIIKLETRYSWGSHPPDPKNPATGKYHRDITIEQPMVVDNFLLTLRLEQGKVNDANLMNGVIAYKNARIPFNLSGNGQSVVPGLLGLHLPKGAKLTLQTNAPVEEGSIKITGQKADKNDNPILAVPHPVYRADIPTQLTVPCPPIMQQQPRHMRRRDRRRECSAVPETKSPLRGNGMRNALAPELPSAEQKVMVSQKDSANQSNPQTKILAKIVPPSLAT